MTGSLPETTSARSIPAPVGPSRYVGRFDREDYELVDLVNEQLAQPALPGDVTRLFDSALHPRGVKELTAPRDMRVAFAIMHLLDSLEAGRAEERLDALRALRDEVSGRAPGTLPRNAARVLVQTMKELLRTRHDRGRQLELAHEFRTASAGNPRHIRRLLHRHHLLEMPEAWNQVAFDDHVHDVHTKGRKSPSHLILDAWIKGIRRLTVVYYHYVPSAAAAELLEAAATMGVNVRVGVEFKVALRDRFVSLMWIPRGFSGAEDFQAFLDEPRVRALFAEGMHVAAWRRRQVIATLEAFNREHREVLAAELATEIPPLSPDDFVAFVGDSQASLVHLGEFIEARLLPRLQSRLAELRASAPGATAPQRIALEQRVAAMRELDAEAIVERFLVPEVNPGLPDPARPSEDRDAPRLLSLSARALVERLNALPSGYRLTLNCSGVDADDVLELLQECAGRITHLEIFNLKDHAAGRGGTTAEIDRLRLAIIDPNPRPLKRLLHERIQRARTAGNEALAERLDNVLQGLAELRGHYARAPLRACLGSDSTGRSRRFPGMGLAVVETLPPKARRSIERGGPEQRRLPVQAQVHGYRVWPPSRELALGRRSALTRRQVEDWSEPRGPRRGWVLDEVCLIEGTGNLATLGGLRESGVETLTLQSPAPRPPPVCWHNLPTGWKNALKVLIGFVPAFATFALTKEWWLLAYLGAPLWFVITALRNALQSMLGGCGLRRGLLQWRDQINWSRLADSLLFTGFSVPLLDYLVKSLLLDRLLGINTATAPVLLYGAIALANGVYISTHNVLRELPREAVVGNAFRSVLAIPVAIGLSAALTPLLVLIGVDDPLSELQAWAAVITKLASDLVAGVIEGLADRRHNVRQRLADYGSKLRDFLETFNRLEVLLPGTDVLALLHSPKDLLRTARQEAADLEKALILHTLDLLYFWMYQPRSRTALRVVLRSLPADERQVVLHAGRLLTREREISELLLHGAAGHRFDRALAFYLSHASTYRHDMERLESSLSRWAPRGATPPAP